MPQPQQGEGIKVIDRRTFRTAVAPKRLVLMGMGLAAGLAIGLLLADCLKFPAVHIQTSEDAAHYTSLPVLMTVPD